MSQLILESENERNLELIQELAEKLNIRCRFILQKVKPESIKQDEISEAISFVGKFMQESTSFDDALTWQKSERQERSLD